VCVRASVHLTCLRLRYPLQPNEITITNLDIICLQTTVIISQWYLQNVLISVKTAIAYYYNSKSIKQKQATHISSKQCRSLCYFLCHESYDRPLGLRRSNAARSCSRPHHDNVPSDIMYQYHCLEYLTRNIAESRIICWHVKHNNDLSSNWSPLWWIGPSQLAAASFIGNQTAPWCYWPNKH